MMQTEAVVQKKAHTKQQQQQKGAPGAKFIITTIIPQAVKTGASMHNKFTMR